MRALGLPPGTTPQRLDRGVATGLLTTDERDTLAGGFDSVYTLLYDHEARAVRAGAEPSTFVSPAALDSLTRSHLRETFRAIRHVQIRADQDWIRRLTHDR